MTDIENIGCSSPNTLCIVTKCRREPIFFTALQTPSKSSIVGRGLCDLSLCRPFMPEAA